jgi:hypothetical protein
MLSYELNQYVLILRTPLRPQGFIEIKKYLQNVQEVLEKIPLEDRSEQFAEFQKHLHAEGLQLPQHLRF